MSLDRRADGPTLLQARVGGARRWGRRAVMTVRVTSRCLHWHDRDAHTAVEWTQVLDVTEQDGAMRVDWVDDAGRRQVLVVELEGPVGYLVYEDSKRRTDAAARNAARTAEPVAV